MDIQSKKLSLIEWLSGLQDESLINILDNIRKQLDREDFKSSQPISTEEYIAKLERSMMDYEKGNYLSLEELQQEIMKW